ncbi:MAG: hypothetical protein L6V93_22125 [Clostridiales bacterium]|nr:MAG: hypothetical protein L6V93_22125 [Clostridiales bacterium]
MFKFKKGELTDMAKALFAQERAIKRLDGWFIAQETIMKTSGKYKSKEIDKANTLLETVKNSSAFGKRKQHLCRHTA